MIFSSSSLLTPRPFGITLTEVLISMGILVVGLLSVMAMLPAGGKYMQQGEIADRGAAIAQAAFADLVTKGMLNPEAWRVWDDQGMSPMGYSGTPISRLPAVRDTFTRPFGDKLRTFIAATQLANSTAIVKQQDIAREFGSAFVIDPMAIASVSFPMDNPSNFTRLAGVFPRFQFDDSGNYDFQIPAWEPWRDTSTKTWPIRRVTFLQSANQPLLPAVAEWMMSGRNDLAIELPDSADEPANQLWQEVDLVASEKGPAARQWRGDYSWIATVAPTSAKARDALATEPTAYYYDVSVVVYYKRAVARSIPMDQDAFDSNDELLKQSEGYVMAKILSTGLNGGEVLLEAVDDEFQKPFSKLKVGEWTMLCGPHPLSSPENPMFAMNWYRVLSIDGESDNLDEAGRPSTGSQPERRIVALRGPQWPWEPAASLTNTNALSNRLCVTITPGAVAVHNRKIRLEGRSLWSTQ